MIRLRAPSFVVVMHHSQASRGMAIRRLPRVQLFPGSTLTDGKARKADIVDVVNAVNAAELSLELAPSRSKDELCILDFEISGVCAASYEATASSYVVGLHVVLLGVKSALGSVTAIKLGMFF